jgi:dTDP-4-dehydrorhamnose reductase
MKILITGSNGFIGKYLSEKFASDCIATTRQTLDLSKKQSVDDFFSK